MEKNDMKVSIQTQEFVKSVRALNEHYELTRRALVEVYGGCQADVIMGKEYTETFLKLRKIALEFLLWEIDENISRNDFNEI